MRRISCLLLLSATAIADEPDLVAIADTMAARESATFPFVVRYRGGVGRGAFVATYAGERGRGLWRGTVSVPVRRGFRDQEQLWKRYRGGWLHGWHEPHRWLTEWRGSISEDVSFRWPVLPVDFGLEQASQPLSRFLRRPSARLAGAERVGAFDCVKVLVDWIHERTTTIQHPLGLWLAPAHGYYPVRTVVYALRDGSEFVDRDVVEIDGRAFKPREWREVTRLASVGAARFPTEGRRDARLGASPEDYVAVASTVRVGDAVGGDAFDLPAFMYVIDHRRQGRLWITPIGGIPVSWLWIIAYLVCAFGIGWAIRALRRWWRRPRDPEAVAWEREPMLH